MHTHAAKAGTLGRLAAAAHGVPVVLHSFHGHVFHSYFSPWKTNLFIRIEQFLAKKSTSIIAISRQQKDELSNKYAICNPEKIEVIPLGFNLEKFSTGQTAKRIKFREQYHVEDNEIVIVIVGRLVPVKNHALFLHVLHALKSQTSKKIRAFIIGDGEYRNQLESM